MNQSMRENHSVEDEPLLRARPAPLGVSMATSIHAQGGVVDSDSHVSLVNRVPSFFSIHHEKTESGESLATILHEAKKLIHLSSALVIGSLASFLVPLVTLSFVGHIGKHELSVTVLAASFFNVTGYAMVVGSLGALETLVANAHGAKAHGQKGIILQRSLCITLILCILVTLLWTKMGSIMILAGQEEHLAKDASKYLLMTSPSLFFLASGEALKKYFTCQSLVIAPTVASIAAAICTLLYNYVFITMAGLGLTGAAIAANMAQCTPLCILIVWLFIRERRLKDEESDLATFSRDGVVLSKEIFENWSEYIKLAIPSAAMVGLEWGIFEMCLLMSGWLEDPELHVAVMGLSLNLSGTFYMLPQGLSSGCAVRVGNAVGANLPRRAKRSAWVAVALTMVCQVVIGTIAVLERNNVGLIFSDDMEVLVETAKVIPLVALCMIGDGLNASIGGSFRGLGKQDLAAIFNLVNFWGIGMPMAYFLAFKVGLGVKGLWAGLGSCAFINGGVMLFALLKKIDWEKCITECGTRLHDFDS